MLFGYFNSKNKNQAMIVLGIVLLGIVLSVAGCIGTPTSPETRTAPPAALPPDAVITSKNLRTSIEGTHYYTYYDVSVHNFGGAGTVVVWATVAQGGSQWTKSQTIYLNERDSRDLTFTFIEPSFWDSNSIRGQVWVEN